MKEYFLSVILIAAISQLILTVIPGNEQDTFKKPMRFLSGMVLLCVISAPVTDMIAAIQDGALDSVEHILETDSGVITEENTVVEERMWELALQNTANNWIKYLAEQYNIANESINIVFITEDEIYAIHHVQVFLQKCPYTLRKDIENDLRKKMEPIPVYVFGE